MSKQITSFYTVIDTGYGCYIKFIVPPACAIQESEAIYQDAGEASQEFLKLYPGAQYLGKAGFAHKARVLDERRKMDMEKLKTWK